MTPVIIIRIILSILMLVSGIGVIILILLQSSNSEGTAALSGAKSQQDTYLGRNQGKRKEAQYKLWTFIIAGVLAVCSIVFFILGL